MMLLVTDPFRLELAEQIVEEFTEQYYIYMNEQRNMITRMYLDDAIQTFETTDKQIVGKYEIQKFWLNMPYSDHTILSFTNVELNGSHFTLTIRFKVRGEMKYKGRSRPFFQYFLIIKRDLTWKIIRNHFKMLSW